MRPKWKYIHANMNTNYVIFDLEFTYVCYVYVERDDG